MPYYDYVCTDCKRRATLFFKSFAEYDTAVPQCPHCQSQNIRRRIGRVALAKGEDSRMETLADEGLAGVDENDPRSLGRFMRQMSHEMGEDLGDEFGEVVDRLEKGQSPEDIEKAIPSLADSAPSMPSFDD
jgi:putative FmdB family regulatory protein